MKKPFSMIPLLLLCSALLFGGVTAVSALETTQPQSDQVKAYIRLGVEASLNMEFEKAYHSLQKAVASDPENPIGFAYLSMIHLMDSETNLNDALRKQNQELMLRYVDETLSLGKKRIASLPKDGQAYLAMAMVKIAKLNWAIHKKKYFTIIHEASHTWDYLESAKESDPQNFDVYFLVGFFHYHIDRLPGLSRFLSSLFVTSGDRRRGLEEIELAAHKGDLFKDMALLELSSDYLLFEKQPELALAAIVELKKKFPNNYSFYFSLGNALSDLHRFDEAFKVAHDIEKNILAGTPPFSPQLQPRCDQLMGRIFFTQGDYMRSKEYLQRALRDTSACNARVRSWSFVRMGMICDLSKDREKAQSFYAKALDVEGGEGAAQLDAKKYLKTPYVP